MRDITDEPEFYLGYEMVKLGNKIHVSSNNHVKEVLQRYPQKHGDIKKEVL